MKINYIIIHDTEGSYDNTISTFQNPASYVSANVLYPLLRWRGHGDGTPPST